VKGARGPAAGAAHRYQNQVLLSYWHSLEWLAHQLAQDVKRRVFRSRHPGPVPPEQTWQEQMKSMAGAGVVDEAAAAAARAVAMMSFLSMLPPSG
jgi:hypothetical protein